MSSSEKASEARKRAPVSLRATFALSLIASLASGVILDRVVLPHGGSHFGELGIEAPTVAKLGIGIETFVHAWLGRLVVAFLTVIVLAWRGALDRLLKPGIVVALLAALLLVGVTLGTWNANQGLLEALAR